MTISPHVPLKAGDPNYIANLMFSNSKVRAFDEGRKPDVLLPYEECPRVQQLQKKERFAFDADGKPVSKNRVYQLRDAIAEPIINKYYEDPTLISFGEDVRDWGGAFAVYRGMTEAIPYHRLFNSPIAEAGIVAPPWAMPCPAAAPWRADVWTSWAARDGCSTSSASGSP